MALDEFDLDVAEALADLSLPLTEVKLNGEELLIMKESDILGIVEDRKGLKKAA